jgi:hypothetical protein
MMALQPACALVQPEDLLPGQFACSQETAFAASTCTLPYSQVLSSGAALVTVAEEAYTALQDIAAASQSRRRLQVPSGGAMIPLSSLTEVFQAISQVGGRKGGMGE